MHPALSALLFSRPSWVQSGALVDLDPVNNRYWNGSLLVPIDSILSCSRASSKTLTWADGTLTTILSNANPRSDLGLLVEAAATNLVLRSQEFNNAAWSKSNCTISADAIAAPDGSTTADKLVEASGTSQHKDYQHLTGTSGSAYAWSTYGKAAERNWGYIDAADDAAGDLYAYFDLTNGVVGTVAVGCTAAIEALAGGFYRARVTRTISDVNIYMQCGSTTADNTASSVGDNTKGLYWWGAQLELGSKASSYIPTTSGSATRAADAITIQRTGIGRMVFTFDDNSQQTVSGIDTGAQYVIPTNLNRPLIKRATGYAS